MIWNRLLSATNIINLTHAHILSFTLTRGTFMKRFIKITISKKFDNNERDSMNLFGTCRFSRFVAYDFHNFNHSLHEMKNIRLAKWERWHSFKKSLVTLSFAPFNLSFAKSLKTFKEQRSTIHTKFTHLNHFSLFTSTISWLVYFVLRYFFVSVVFG